MAAAQKADPGHKEDQRAVFYNQLKHLRDQSTVSAVLPQLIKRMRLSS